MLSISSLDSASDRITYNVASCFFPHFLSLRRCDGGTHGILHQQIDCTPKPLKTIFLFDEDHPIYAGDAGKFVQGQSSASRCPDVIAQCWRNNQDRRPDHCDGSATLLRIWTSYPLCLRLELPDEQDADALLVWKFPEQIQLTGLDSNGNEVVCFYDIVGRAIFELASSHFTSCTADSNGQCYMYDDLSNDGWLAPVRGGVPFEDVRGIGDEMKGHLRRTVAVVYHLRGGTKDQEDLFRKTRVDLSRFHHLSMTRPTNRISPYVFPCDSNLKVVDDSRVSWMKNPTSCVSIDYDGPISLFQHSPRRSTNKEGKHTQARVESSGIS